MLDLKIFFEQMDKQIFYDKNSKFVVSPKIKPNDIQYISEHILKSRGMVNNFCSGNTVVFPKLIEFSDIQFLNERKEYFSHLPDEHHYFWTFDPSQNSIVVDGNTKTTFGDIFNQFIEIAFWFFSNNYSLKGTFYCRRGDIIEYFETDGINKVIIHCLVFDKIGILEMNNFIDGNSLNGNKIIDDCKKKIKKYMKNNSPKLINYEHIIKNDNEIEKNTISSLMYEETQSVIKNLQERLIVVENKVKYLTRANKTLWKFCTIFGLVTVGYVIIYNYCDNEMPKGNGTGAGNF